ncbi:MAG: hypothetical protein ACYCY5_09970 [Sulfuricella sp.]
MNKVHREVEVEGLDAGRVASILVAIVCMAVAHFLVKHEILHLAIAVLVLPLGCIWYGSEIGFFVGMSATGEDNPGNAIGTAIEIVGWIILLAILAGLILLAWSE